MNKRLFMFSLRFIIIGIVQTLCWNSHSTWHHSPSSIAPLEKLFLFPQNHTKQTHTANAPENKPTTFPTRRTLVPFPSFDFFSFKRTIFPTAQYLPTSFHPQSLTVAQPSQPNTHTHTSQTTFRLSLPSAGKTASPRSGSLCRPPAIIPWGCGEEEELSAWCRSRRRRPRVVAAAAGHEHSPSGCRGSTRLTRDFRRPRGPRAGFGSVMREWTACLVHEPAHWVVYLQACECHYVRAAPLAEKSSMFRFYFWERIHTVYPVRPSPLGMSLPFVLCRATERTVGKNFRTQDHVRAGWKIARLYWFITSEAFSCFLACPSVPTGLRRSSSGKLGATFGKGWILTFVCFGYVSRGCSYGYILFKLSR